MFMNTKLIAALACGAALALGACSGGGPASPTAPIADDPAADPGEDTRTPAEKFDNDQKAALDGLDEARRTVTAAVDLANRAVTDEARKTARAEVDRATMALDEAVRAARALTAPSGDETRRFRARGVAARADDDLAELTKALDGALNSLAWYRQSLARYRIPKGAVTLSSEATNTVTINRIDRTITVDGVVTANPAAFTSTTFKDVMYADGKKVFSTTGDGDGGDEFKVDGWVGWKDSDWSLEEFTYTGLKLTNAGLVIRTGGTTSPSREGPLYRSDFTDMRRDITKYANDPDGDDTAETPPGQNGWDLVLTFGEPQTMSVPVVGEPSGNFQSSRMGNGDFYWKTFVPAARSQTETSGDYYAANAFNHPNGQENLGTYEVWLSNHADTDTKLEPVAGSGDDPHPIDDERYYLQYAAYGLFVFTADTETYFDDDDNYAYNGRVGRISTIHFGYSAFRDADGQRTTDIGEAITNGKFHGHTLAYETQGGREVAINSRLMRGDVTLTVNIPKGTGAGTLEGTMSNFQRWVDEGKYWADYAGGLSVALNSVAINDDGTFVGSTQATPTSRLNLSGAGLFRGSFYGPRTDRSDLEIAGSWTVGTSFGPGYSNGDLSNNGYLYASRKTLYGSFAAKQRPDAAPASN